MKGLIALAKKNESISDKIVRLYKEGYSIPEIAKEMEMPKAVSYTHLRAHET